MPTRLAVDRQGDELFLEGIIDEDADLIALVERAMGGRLTLDLAGITFINSLGVRAWIRMQQAAASLKVGIELRRVAVPLVNQLNIVPATRGMCMVSSFFAPYECTHCDEEHDVLLDMRSHGIAIARKQMPAAVCPECRRAVAMSTPPELYFAFLA